MQLTPPMITSPNLHAQTLTGNYNTEAVQPSDCELMCAIQEGDAHALEMLLTRHHGLLKSVILHVVNSHASADDVLQECLVAIWNRANNYCATKGSPLSWMVTMAKRRAIDSVRRDASFACAKNRLEGEVRCFIPTQSAECEEADMARVIDDQIKLLPEKQQEVIRLAFLDGMSQREVAEATQAPLGTVKTRMELGLNKLRATFVRHRMCLSN